MATATIEALDLPFEQAIAFMLQRRDVLPTKSYREITRQNQEYSLGIAGLEDATALRDFKAALDRYVNDGGSRQDFEKDFDRIAADAGWKPNLGRPFRTWITSTQNFLSAFGEGRRQQLEEFADEFPYLQIMPSIAREPREDHKQFDNLLLSRDDPFWGAYGYPPWGYACTHRVRGITEAARRRENKKVDKSRIRYQNVRGQRIPVGLDPQFVPARKNRDSILQRLASGLSPITLTALAGLGILNRRRLGLPDPVPAPIPQPDRDQDLSLIQKFIRFQLRALTAAGINTLLEANSLDYSGDPTILANQLIQRGIFNYGVANVVGFTARDLDPKLGFLSQIIFSGYTVTEASRIFRSNLQRGAAKNVGAKFSEQDIDEIRQRVKQKKTKQKTYGMAGNVGADRAARMMEISLSRSGVSGDVQGIVNPYSTPDTSNTRRAIVETFLGTSDAAQEVAEQILRDLINNPDINKINFVGYSAGSMLMEDVAGILYQLGIEIDDIVTIGGIGAPTRLGQNTRFRRYFSDADFHQILRIPEPSAFDRFYSGIQHHQWTQRDIFTQIAADLNQFFDPPGGPITRMDPRTPEQIEIELQQIRDRVGSITPEQIKQIEQQQGAIITEAPAQQRQLGPARNVRAGNVDINTASISELLDLPITTRQAASLKRWVNQNGPIADIDDLINVPDFGPRTIERIKAINQSGQVSGPEVDEAVLEREPLITPPPEPETVADRPAPVVWVGGAFGKRVDINTATVEEMVQNTVLNARQAGRLSRWIRDNGPITSFDQLIELSRDPSNGLLIGQKTIDELQKDLRQMVRWDQIRAEIQIVNALQGVKGINKQAIAAKIYEEIRQNGPYRSEQDMRQRLSKIRGVGPRTIETLLTQTVLFNLGASAPQRQSQQQRQQDQQFSEGEQEDGQIYQLEEAENHHTVCAGGRDDQPESPDQQGVEQNWRA